MWPSFVSVAYCYDSSSNQGYYIYHLTCVCSSSRHNKSLYNKRMIEFNKIFITCRVNLVILEVLDLLDLLDIQYVMNPMFLYYLCYYI